MRFRRPRCPLTPEDEEWVHFAARRIVGALGRERVLATEVLTPSSPHMPQVRSTSDEAISALWHSIGLWMGTDPFAVRLEIHDDPMEKLRRRLNLTPLDEGGCTLGTYDLEHGPRIRISREHISSAIDLVATIAHEFCHHVLISELFLPADAPDHEPATDLAMVFTGMGWFGAASSVIDRFYTSGGYEGWTIGRSGYLPQILWAYALALLAHLRGERRPKWINGLSPSVRGTFRRGLRYIASIAEPGVLPRA